MTQRDRPAIIAPPPLLYLAAFALVVLLESVRPLSIPDHGVTAWIGWVALAAGLALNLWGAWSMKRARTPISPYRPADTIVTLGAFRVSRNPLYVGLDLVLLGLVLVLDSLWGLIVLAVLVAIMHYGVVLPEERYLEEKFGQAYRQYQATVRRYL